MTGAPRSHSIGHVSSADGTPIGYRRFGTGPGCLLLHGALQASGNLTNLAAALADRFTVYVPDRRGRGLSGPADETYDIHTECQDVAAIVGRHQVRNIFGHSSGAISALHVARTLPAIAKVAVYEPPLTIEQPPRWMARYRAELARDDLASALLTVLEGTRSAPPALAALPRFAATPLLRLAIAAEARRPAGDGHVPLRDLIPTMRFEPRPETPDITAYAEIPAHVLLLGGERSPHYLRQALDRLESTLPHADRIKFPGLDHSGPDNRGHPGTVGTALAQFFT